MTTDELKARTKSFALRVTRLVDALPNTVKGRAIANQIMHSASSVAANYRAACRAQSQAHFISKLSIVEEEADESMYWLELLAEMGFRDDAELHRLHAEADEIVAIMVSSKKTARRP